MLGATAVGKTALITQLAPILNSVIYADTSCLYKDLNIASAKPSPSEQSILPHYGINLLDINQVFDAPKFTSYADDIIAQLPLNSSTTKQTMPLLSGSALFYVKQFLFGASKAKPSNPITRARVEDEFNRLGQEAFYHKLKTIDSISANRININDVYRLKRSLEIFYDSGMPQSSFETSNTLRDNYDFCIVVLHRDREDLYRRINLRVDEMFANGLADEITRLKKMGATLDTPAMKGIGYSEWFNDNYKTDNEIKEAIKQNSRHYAKRQITFLKHQIGDRATVFHADDSCGIEKHFRVFMG